MLPAVSWPWVPAWGSLEPPRRDGENAQKTGKFGGKMGEIWTKKCEPRELTKDQLAGGRAAPVVQPRYEAGVGALPRVRPHHAQLHPYAPSPFLCDSTWTTFLSWLFLSTMSCLILCHIPRHFPVHLDGTFSLPLLSFSPGQDSHPKLVVRAQGRVCTCAASGWWTSRRTISTWRTSRR